MKTKIRVFSLAVLFLLVALSGCVTQQTETTASQQTETTASQQTENPISIKAEYTEKTVRLYVERTDGKELPELEAMLIDQSGKIKIIDSDKSFYIKGAGIRSTNFLLMTDFEGNYTIVLRKSELNETIYRTNWTVSFPHYKVNEAVLMKNGISIVFRPYQTGKSFQEKGVSYKRITIPIELKNVDSLKEERAMIKVRTLLVDIGYTYEPRYGYYSIDKSLKPKEEAKEEIAFDIAEDTEPIKMYGALVFDFYTETDFILDLSK